MRNFLLGMIFGLVVATIGFSGISRLLDRGVDLIKEKSVELTR